jgi:hypothetical protein
MKILYNSEKMKRIFDEPPIVSYKRDKNIKDILVQLHISIIMQS